ncbi:MAG: hypothetical protein AAF413_04545 [Patescibacteria group bacterium]
MAATFEVYPDSDDREQRLYELAKRLAQEESEIPTCAQPIIDLRQETPVLDLATGLPSIVTRRPDGYIVTSPSGLHTDALEIHPNGPTPHGLILVGGVFVDPRDPEVFWENHDRIWDLQELASTQNSPRRQEKLLDPLFDLADQLEADEDTEVSELTTPEEIKLRNKLTTTLLIFDLLYKKAVDEATENELKRLHRERVVKSAVSPVLNLIDWSVPAATDSRFENFDPSEQQDLALYVLLVTAGLSHDQALDQLGCDKSVPARRRAAKHADEVDSMWGTPDSWREEYRDFTGQTADQNQLALEDATRSAAHISRKQDGARALNMRRKRDHRPLSGPGKHQSAWLDNYRELQTQARQDAYRAAAIAEVAESTSAKTLVSSDGDDYVAGAVAPSQYAYDQSARENQTTALGMTYEGPLIPFIGNIRRGSRHDSVPVAALVIAATMTVAGSSAFGQPPAPLA